MPQVEQHAQQAEILAGQISSAAQQPHQKGGIITDVLELGADVVDAVTSPGDLFSLVASGARSAASGVADLAAATLDLVGSAACGALDSAGSAIGAAAETAGEAIGDAAAAVVDVIAGILS